MKKEYRVVWKREGTRQKSRRFATKWGALRFLKLFGPSPWNAYSCHNPDDYVCCSGRECACEGMTYRQQSEEMYTKMPILEYFHLEEREVGEFTEVECEAV